jgi:hypothetical protein
MADGRPKRDVLDDVREAFRKQRDELLVLRSRIDALESELAEREEVPDVPCWPSCETGDERYAYCMTPEERRTLSGRLVKSLCRACRERGLALGPRRSTKRETDALMREMSGAMNLYEADE